MAAGKEYDSRQALDTIFRTGPTEVPETLARIAHSLGGQPPLLRQLYLAYWHRKEVFAHKPRIGAELRVGFDWDSGDVLITQLKDSFRLTQERFLALLGAVDACYSEIHPVGTVAELDVGMIPEDIRGMFEGDGPGAFVTLTGRMVDLAGNFTGYILDYVSRLWPFGESPAIGPILVSNMMIRRIIVGGLTNEWEKKFAVRLRQERLNPLRMSTAFMPVDDRRLKAGSGTGAF